MNRSHGTFEPAEIVRRAAERELGVEVVPGVEFSAEHEKTSIHYLAGVGEGGVAEVRDRGPDRVERADAVRVRLISAMRSAPTSSRPRSPFAWPRALRSAERGSSVSSRATTSLPHRSNGMPSSSQKRWSASLPCRHSRALASPGASLEESVGGREPDDAAAHDRGVVPLGHTLSLDGGEDCTKREAGAESRPPAMASASATT